MVDETIQKLSRSSKLVQIVMTFQFCADSEFRPGDAGDCGCGPKLSSDYDDRLA